MNGILFSKELIPAVLNGTKTVTRRVLNPQPDKDCQLEEMCKTTPEGWQTVGHSFKWWDGSNDERIWKPRYHEGETLYVKEAYTIIHYDQIIIYRRECDNEQEKIALENSIDGKWHSPLFMPEWASRCKLTILKVSVERLQEITEEEAQSEGVERLDISPRYLPDLPPPFNQVHPMTSTYIEAFIKIWNSLNKERGYSWEANPWVFRYQFERQGK